MTFCSGWKLPVHVSIKLFFSLFGMSTYVFPPWEKDRCDVIVSVTKIWTWLLATLHISPTSSSWCSGFTCWWPRWSWSTFSLLWWATPTSGSRWSPAAVWHLTTTNSDDLYSNNQTWSGSLAWPSWSGPCTGPTCRPRPSTSSPPGWSTSSGSAREVGRPGVGKVAGFTVLLDGRVQWMIIKSIIFYVNTVLDISRKES